MTSIAHIASTAWGTVSHAFTTAGTQVAHTAARVAEAAPGFFRHRIIPLIEERVTNSWVVLTSGIINGIAWIYMGVEEWLDAKESLNSEEFFQAIGRGDWRHPSVIAARGASIGTLYIVMGVMIIASRALIALSLSVAALAAVALTATLIISLVSILKSLNMIVTSTKNLIFFQELQERIDVEDQNLARDIRNLERDHYLNWFRLGKQFRRMVKLEEDLAAAITIGEKRALIQKVRDLEHSHYQEWFERIEFDYDYRLPEGELIQALQEDLSRQRTDSICTLVGGFIFLGFNLAALFTPGVGLGYAGAVVAVAWFLYTTHRDIGDLAKDIYQKIAEAITPPPQVEHV